MSWELLWKVVFVGVIGVFAVMSVLVTIFGARDIKRLLGELEQERDEADSE